MNHITYLLSFITPQLIEKVPSEVNGTIDVELTFGSYRLSVNKYWQSGKYPTHILSKALRLTKIQSNNIKNILVLGLGGGSIVEVINNLYPEAKILGVDLDPQMIASGKKYLSLDKARNLKIVIDDASKFVAREKSNKKFDMIISDLFIGCDVPESTITDQYLGNIFSLLTNKGVYILNLPYRGEYKSKTDFFVQRLKKHFPYLETKNIPPHLLIWAYKQ